MRRDRPRKLVKLTEQNALTASDRTCQRVTAPIPLPKVGHGDERDPAHGRRRECRQTLREYMFGGPGVGRARSRIRLSNAVAPTRLTKKAALPLVSEVGWTRSTPVRSQNRKTVRMGTEI
jgi:hypothetical protein